jgi:hypothetical protein
MQQLITAEAIGPVGPLVRNAAHPQAFPACGIGGTMLGTDDNSRLREKAARVRAEAEIASSKEAKSHLLEIAAAYDQLAQLAERIGGWVGKRPSGG